MSLNNNNILNFNFVQRLCKHWVSLRLTSVSFAGLDPPLTLPRQRAAVIELRFTKPGEACWRSLIVLIEHSDAAGAMIASCSALDGLTKRLQVQTQY